MMVSGRNIDWDREPWMLAIGVFTLPVIFIPEFTSQFKKKFKPESRKR